LRYFVRNLACIATLQLKIALFSRGAKTIEDMGSCVTMENLNMLIELVMRRFMEAYQKEHMFAISAIIELA
jgi:hypothetical protein